MVRGFLIHTVALAGAEPCGLLYRRLFSGGAVEAEPMAAVARQVGALCLLRRQLSARPDSEEAAAVQEEEVGVLALPAGAPFPQEAVVLWLGLHSLGFCLICDPQENLTLAEATLRTVVKQLLESRNAALQADKVELVLDTFLPQGALLFLGHQAVQALEKELSSSSAL